MSDVTLLGLGVRLRDDGLGCGDERCCFRRKRGDNEGDLLFGDLKRNDACEFLTHNIGITTSTGKWEIYTIIGFSNLIVMGASSAALSKSAALLAAAAAMIWCFVAPLPSFAGEDSLELAPDDVMEFILVSIAEANLKRGKSEQI